MQKLLRLKQVQALTGLSRSHLYSLASKGQFPKSVKLSQKSVGWIETEVQDWIDARIKQRNELGAA